MKTYKEDNFRFRRSGTRLQVLSIVFTESKAEMNWTDEDGNRRYTSYDIDYLWNLIEPCPKDLEPEKNKQSNMNKKVIYRTTGEVVEVTEIDTTEPRVCYKDSKGLIHNVSGLDYVKDFREISDSDFPLMVGQCKSGELLVQKGDSKITILPFEMVLLREQLDLIISGSTRKYRGE